MDDSVLCVNGKDEPQERAIINPKPAEQKKTGDENEKQNSLYARSMTLWSTDFERNEFSPITPMRSSRLAMTSPYIGQQ
jgi:hypothetical protein